MNIFKTKLDPIPATRCGSKFTIDYAWCTTDVQYKWDNVVMVTIDKDFLSDDLRIFLDLRVDVNSVKTIE